MAVSINGTGTISGIAAGGFPDGVVQPKNTEVGALPSMVRLNTANGYGSTNTMIRRFTNVVVNQGTDITYADSATLGASFTINKAGVYSISFSDNSSSGPMTVGLSLNSTQLTTAFASTNVADRLASGVAPAVNFDGNISTTVYLAAGSVVRPHCDGQAAGVRPALFTITRVA
jgi:hypothetical protein